MRSPVEMFTLFMVVFLLSSEFTSCFVLRAYISQHGLHGEVEFSHKNASVVSVRTNLNPTLEFPDQIWRWAVHEFPVDYTDISDERCSSDNLGKEIINLTDELGYLIIPGKDHTEFESKNELTGPKGFWGKSLVLTTAESNRVICASIISTEKSSEKMAVAQFRSPIAGTLYFRWISAREFDESDSYIEADLYHSKAVPDKVDFTEHRWKLFVTDVFDTNRNTLEDNCNALQMVFDPDNQGDNSGLGDLDVRLGKVKVAVDRNRRRAKTLFKDESSVIPQDYLENNKRNLYVVIFDSKHPDSFLACAKVQYVHPKSARALINMQGIRGQVELTQRSRFDPSWASFQIASSDVEYESSLRFVSSVLAYRVNSLPVSPYSVRNVGDVCNTTGEMYNPSDLRLQSVPPAGLGTQDQYPLGDLFGKYKGRTEYLNHRYLLPGLSNELSGSYWDIYLPMEGKNSVMHRSVVVERRDVPSVCGTIHQYDHRTGHKTAMLSAQATFRYPLVGRVVFRQPRDSPGQHVTVIVEKLVHADGSNVNDTFGHRWAIHENAPGADFYNWTGRCLSAGKMYDPYQVDTDTRHPEEYCKHGQEGLCRIGDLTTRHGTLTVAGEKKDSDRLTRRLFTDEALSLSGKYSITRKSLVIYDDHGPVARGERMACSIVGGLHPRKAVAKDWFGNGESVSVQGKLEMVQQSEYDVVDVDVDIEGLSDVGPYQIHSASVMEDLEFPCEKTTLYGTYNPFDVNSASVPPPMKGTPDQYELGDLSGKYGSLAGYKKVSTYFNETQMTLFGPHNVVGRSVVLHKSTRGLHWACTSIERGYSPSEARELRAIASFHQPAGFAYGYVRMTQLIYGDNSQSDTVIEVNLRHPGVNDRNMTQDHAWEVWVNPVGVDAAVKSAGTRCVAAGYRWNPYYTQLADPLNHDLYSKECGPDNPLRCHVGDLTSRLGTISLGKGRQVFVDTNLPLEGAFSALGRSVVIMAPNLGSERFACANIEPDKDIVKFANFAKPPRFAIWQLMNEIRGVLGAPEWMVTLDSRRTRVIHGGACVQILVHFKGPQANRLELDFSKLLASGRLESPTIQIPGFVNTKRKKTISYRPCGSTDPNEKKANKVFSPFFSSDAPRRQSREMFFTCFISSMLAYLVRFFVD